MRTLTRLVAALALPLAACGGGANEPPSPPAPPTALVVTATALDAVTLAWTDASADETGFAVERSAGGAPWAEIARVAANATGFVDGAVVPDQDYAYRVRSAGPGGLSAPSGEAVTGTWRIAAVEGRLAAALEATRGDELPATSGSGSGLTVTLLGAVLCAPPAPLAPPSGTPSPPATRYGCDNQVTVTLALGGTAVMMVVETSALYLDLTTTVPIVGTDAGYLLLTRPVLVLSLAAEPTPDGRLRLVAPVARTDLVWDGIDFQSANPGVAGLGSFFLNIFTDQLAAQVLDQFAAAVEADLAGLPAWVP